MFSLICLMIILFTMFIAAYNKKFARLENSYERVLSKVRQEVQQKALNNLSLDLIETLGNNLFAIRLTLAGILTPLQKTIDDINHGLTDPKPEGQTTVLKHVLQALTDIQKNVIDAKKTAADMDMVKIREKLRTNFAEHGLVKNIELELERHTGFEIIKNISGTEYPLHEHKEMVLYHIFQLAISNILVHSTARHIHIDVRYEPESLCLCIEDDGIGFDYLDLQDLRKKGRGIDSMYSAVRLINANLSINSRPGKGTTLTIFLQTLPI